MKECFGKAVQGGLYRPQDLNAFAVPLLLGQDDAEPNPGEKKVGVQAHRLPIGVLGRGELVLPLARVAQQTVTVGGRPILDRGFQNLLCMGVPAGTHQLGCLPVAGVGEDRVQVLGGGPSREEGSHQGATPDDRQSDPCFATVHGACCLRKPGFPGRSPKPA